jgi:hypothetical protein
MPVRPASRRLLVGGTSAALLLGVVGFVPLLGSASAAACPSWVDAEGDSAWTLDPLGADPTGLSGDPDMDILSTGVTVTPAGGLVVAVKVKAMTAYGPEYAAGDEFVIEATVGGVATKVTIKRDGAFTGAETTSLAAAATSAGTATFDPPANTATATFTPEQVKAAIGKPLAGLKMEAFSTFAYGLTQTPAGPSLGFPLYDQSDAPAGLAYTDTGGCGAGGTTPVPSGSPSASASASPSATPSPSPSPTSSVGPDGLFLQPRKGCTTFTDAAGDADPTGIGEFNEGSLDVTQVNLKSPAGALQVYVKLADADAALYEIWSGRVYDVSLTVGGKAVVLSAPGEGPATATVGGTENKDVKATAKVDAKNSNLVFTVPLEGLSKAVATTITAGTAITGTAIATAADSQLGAQAADAAAGTKPEEKTYAYGDNTCFKPPAGKLALDADPRGQYGDTTVLFATLTNTDDVPVQGMKVTAVLTRGKAVSAVTDVDGVAEIRLPLAVPAGAKALAVSFAGNAEVGAVAKTVPFSVVAEKVLLKAAGVRGGAKAVLVDDDRHAVAGQVVTFTVGSKKYSMRTNSKGVAVLSRIAKGTAIKVGYAGAKGSYLATPTYTVRAS